MAAESRLQPRPETPLVVVTILNHRGVTDAWECTLSVLNSDYPNFRVIIIDNGSTDGSGDQLRDLACDPRVTTVRSEENRGCVGGTNLAIASALQMGAPYVLTLSNDIVVRRDVISRLVNIMETEPQTGVIQPCILVHDEPERIWSRGGTFSNWLARGFMPEVDRLYRVGDERVI
ncbi:MAG TPA: glycosyltransferase, partial [Nitrospira sp.]|nr:glycosyltransferase [Nitrospira sp.]